MLDCYFTKASRKLPFQELSVVFRNSPLPPSGTYMAYFLSSLTIFPSCLQYFTIHKCNTIHILEESTLFSRFICKGILMKLGSCLQYVKILESDLFLYLKYRSCLFYSYFLFSNLQLVDL